VLVSRSCRADRTFGLANHRSNKRLQQSPMSSIPNRISSAKSNSALSSKFSSNDSRERRASKEAKDRLAYSMFSRKIRALRPTKQLSRRAFEGGRQLARRASRNCSTRVSCTCLVSHREGGRRDALKSRCRRDRGSTAPRYRSHLPPTRGRRRCVSNGGRQQLQPLRRRDRLGRGLLLA